MDIDNFRDIVVYNFGYSANDDTVDYITNELVEDYCDSLDEAKRFLNKLFRMIKRKVIALQKEY